MEMSTKIIAGESFQLSSPYTAGHVLTEAEASQLNQVRKENIGNNLRKVIEDAKAKRDNGDDSDFAKLADLVAKYDSEYNFSMGGGGRRLDPVEREARMLATQHVKDLLAAKGLSAKTVPEGYDEESWKAKIEANVEKFSTNDKILALAKKRVSEKKKLADAIGDLDD